MIKIFLSSIACLFILSFCNPSDAQIKQSESLKLDDYFRWLDSVQKVNDLEKALRLGLPIIMKDDNSFAQFQYFDLSGFPIYYITYNLEAAKTISTNQLWTGGNLGLDLNGDSMIIGIWDGGKVRDTHVELAGRVTQMDAASSLSDHATHVAGTLIGQGVKAAAKGMSWKAKLHAYDWSFDELEMGQAASNGLLVSNHSYGNVSGWYNNKTENRWEWYGDTSISANEDYRYGFYDQQARDWDQIAVNNPNYLIVKSAGNDRDDKLPDTETSHWVFDRSTFSWVESSTVRPPEGPYDCINGAGVAKNVLTVGAVNSVANGYSQVSDVVMSSFSGWGPTDDGRIKPDIVGNGVGVNSSTASGDSTYSSYNGTSMASPNVAGSLLLWQEHFKNLYGKPMRAATLKGLAIHTADEAGKADGPDYIFGWGLVNSASAIKLMNEVGEFSELQENTLSNGSSYELIVYNDGSEALKSSISWTDPVASISTVSLDPNDLKLINDLDIRIYRLSDNQEFQPWILDPANPSDDATKGDNIRDNIEQVYLATPQAGFYKIVVTHKSNLASNKAQNYSLFISGIKPKLQVQFTLPMQNVCIENPIVFTGSSLGDATSYYWTFYGLDTLYATGSSPELLFTQAGTYSLKLKISNQFTSDSIELTSAISVWPSPSTKINPLSGLFCSNDSIPYQLSADMAGTVFSGLGVRDSSFIPKNAGAGLHKIYGKLTDSKGCYGKDSIDLNIESAPLVPSISFDKTELVSSSVNNNLWYVHGQAIPGANTQKYTPIEAGLYAVEVNNTAGCISRSSGFYYFMTSTSPIVSSEIKIYPNPSNGIFNVQLENSEKTIGLQIIDLQGKIVYQADYQNQRILDINSPNLKSGVYIVQLKQSSGAFLNQLIQIQN